MTVDHLPQPIADLPECLKHADEGGPADEASGPEGRDKPSPAPAPETTAEADENWQQSGFGSFP